MAISFKKYVDIVSRVIGAAIVPRRDLIGRIFTKNVLVPTNSLIDFTSADDVGAYFGTDSQEYKRAAFYFGFISKNNKKAQKLTFARWNAAAVAPSIIGDTAQKVLASFQAVTDGHFFLTMGTVTAEVGPCDFSGDGDLATVAGTIQAAVQAADVDGNFTGATVTYDAVRGSFNLTGGTAADAVINSAAGQTGTNILPLIGWVNTGLATANDAIFSDGDDGLTASETVQASVDASDNFGSFLFMDAVSDAQKQAISAYIAGLNIKFIYCVGVLQADAATLQDTVKDNAGTSLIIISDTETDQYDEMADMIVLAATDYSARRSVQNYMFQMFNGLSAKVSDTLTSNALDAIRVNYYGVTQTAGTNLAFYQRGYLQGVFGTDPVNTNIYANEMWLKDAAGSDLMNLLLTASAIAATPSGAAQAVTTLREGVVAEALNNGAISVGKELTPAQKEQITTITGVEDAWYQVQDQGYYLSASVVDFENNGVTEYKIVYTLVYAKADAIRKVDGEHSLV